MYFQLLYLTHTMEGNLLWKLYFLNDFSTPEKVKLHSVLKGHETAHLRTAVIKSSLGKYIQEFPKWV